MTTAALSDSPRHSPAVDLFERLGYELDPIEIDLESWASAGFELPIREGDSLTHAGSFDEVEILILDSSDPEAPRAILERYHEFNRILRPLIAVERKDLIEFWGWRANGTIGRLEVPTQPTDEISRRLELIACRPGHDLGARLEVALSRETVSQRFFRGFSATVDSIAEELASSGIESSDARSWAILFLSRILFLFFIQEKEWLDGDRGFILERSTKRSRVFGSFFRPLFFDCLNTPPARRNSAARRLGRIPYLNGGLFRPSRFEETHPDLELSDEIARSILTDLFARFPFTVREEDQSAVAIDPEMLGHVFESLMEEGERARSGSFYTPRPIVDQLVRRAIALRLGIDRECDVSLLSDRERQGLLDQLRSLSVIDPACGSGAFLLSAMREIERLRLACGDETQPDRLRQEIVERSLYGVDLKSEAIQLCELRLWLAVVSARPSGVDTIATVQPLPNLDRNILQGNSLLDPLAFGSADRRSIHRAWRTSLRNRRELIETYRHAIGSRRQTLYRRLRQSDLDLAGALIEESIRIERSELEQIRSQDAMFNLERPASGAQGETRITELETELDRLRNGELSFFSFDLHFSHVMESGGFDLIIGNPPWVRGSKLPIEIRSALRDRYDWLRPLSGSGFPQFELSILFLEKSAAIAREDGIVSMLVPGKLMNTFYAERCRSELETRHTILAIDDWSRDSSLFNADTFPIGITFTPQHRKRPIEITRDGDSWSTDRELIRIADCVSAWSTLPPDLVRELRTIWRRHRSLSDVLGRDPVMGIKTGANRLFFLRDREIGASGLTTRDGVLIPWSALTRCVRGRDVRRWKSSHSTWMLWPEEPGTVEWKRRHAKQLGSSVEELRLAYVRPEHLGWKVAWKDVATRLEAVVIPDTVEILGHRIPLVPNQTLYCLDAPSVDETHLLAAILNSSLMSVLACSIAEPAKDRHFRFFGRTIATMPLPEIDLTCDRERRLIRLSRAAHGGSEVQSELDRLVCELYGVDPDVVETLARWL